MRFSLKTNLKPKGDQPQAIKKLVAGLKKGHNHQTLLGVTGSGKTFSVAKIIENLQRPTLIISPNKTLAAQLYGEFRNFFPDNAVHYFVSYYDYYQPEAYIPQSDTYIEKEAQINEEIDRLRHASTQSLLTRRDTIIVASVSCIYGLGAPEEYEKMSVEITVDQKINRQDFIRQLIDLQYKRNDQAFWRGTFQVKGDVIEILAVTGSEIIRIEFFGNTIEKISHLYTSQPKIAITENRGDFENLASINIFPAKHYVVPFDKQKLSLANIENELNERLEVLKKENKLLEAQRLQQRTHYDLEMIRETGYCNGIENYSRHFDFRKPGEPPNVLLDFFPADYLTFIDESHVAVPQVKGMYFGDRSRKEVLIEHGFRLPSAKDNRPLQFEEFEKKSNQVIYTSATPSDYEIRKSKAIVEQLVRPTGLTDPPIDVRQADGQIKDLISEIEKRVKKHQRVLITTLTKRMSEELTDYLLEKGIKVQYLHSEIDTLKRVEILRDLRKGEYNCVVGINLLREGLDLPEVSLVAILDADKQGFLRNETTLIQTMGRAARHVDGQVIMYADRESNAMKNAIEETERRRKVQLAYNKKHKIKPKSITKEFYEPIVNNSSETPPPLADPELRD